MPLPEIHVAREALHQRQILCRGFRREDGLWDIEGRMLDTKEYAFDSSWRGRMEPGAPVHDMWARLTLDDRMEVRELVVSSDHHPFPNCAEIESAYGTLVGTRLEPGWTRLVRERLGGVSGCTHITRLIQELAVVAVQTIFPVRARETGGDRGPGDRKPGHLDGCHALATDGPVVRELYPRWYRGRE
ncbi:MAG: DUF2889 domain-containing protein [Gammaproteobacteria bacterium]